MSLFLSTSLSAITIEESCSSHQFVANGLRPRDRVLNLVDRRAQIYKTWPNCLPGACVVEGTMLSMRNLCAISALSASSLLSTASGAHWR